MYRLMLVVCLSMALAHSASFDCEKASSELEKAICSSRWLSKADEDMADAYSALMTVLSDQEKPILRKSQRAWIRQRNSMWEGYADNDYVEDFYKARTQYLQILKDRFSATEPERLPVTVNKNELFKELVGILTEQENLALAYVVSVPGYWDTERCENALEDFLAGRDFRVLEPSIVTSDIYDRRLQVELGFPSRDDLATTYLEGNGLSSELTYYPTGEMELYSIDPALQGYQYLLIPKLKNDYLERPYFKSSYYQFDPDLSISASIDYGASGHTGIVDEQHFNPSFVIDIYGEIAFVTLDTTETDRHFIALTINTLRDNDLTRSTKSCLFRKTFKKE